MSITFQIGFNLYNNYKFNQYDNIKLKVKKKYNLNIEKKGKQKITIHFLHKNNNSIINIQKYLNNNKIENINNFKNKLKKEYNIIKDTIELSALSVSKMTDNELNYFSYLPPDEIIYKPIKLPIDPYYVGFWLGDGHSAVPGRFTCGGESNNGGCNDQEYIIPFMENFAKNLKLDLKKQKDKRIEKEITFSISGGLYTNDSNNRCYEEDWLDDVIIACKQLDISKNTKSPYHNFKNNYNPCIKYSKNNDYYCNHIIEKKVNIILAKHIDNNNWIEFENVKDAVKNTNCGESTIYKSIKENIYINNWIYKKNTIIKNIKCNYNTTSIINNRKNRNINNSKIDSMCSHLKNIHNIKIYKKDIWNNLINEDKLKWKICNDKKDICKNSKYLSSVTLSDIYKIYKENGIEGLKKYQQDQINKCNPLNYWFRKLNLINNKHIPDIYLKSSINDRKKLLAGIIDSDGTSGGKNRNNIAWYIIQKNIKIIDGIEKLAKSLGMFTIRNEKQCRAKKKDGSYSDYITCYGITIKPYNNWNIPILLERKIINKCSDEGKGGTYLNIKNENTKINNIQLSEEEKIILYSVIYRYKYLLPTKDIEWTKLSEYDNRLKHINSKKLKSIYYSKLINEKNKYDELVIPLDFNIIID